MSRNEKRIRDVCEELGIRVQSLIWEPVTRGLEMCGPGGGWLLNEFDPIGYSTDGAIAWLRERASLPTNNRIVEEGEQQFPDDVYEDESEAVEEDDDEPDLWIPDGYYLVDDLDGERLVKKS